MTKLVTQSLRTAQPKYGVLAEQLRQKIQSDEFKPGDKLPTFAEMRSVYGVTSTTVERVYGLLEHEGLIERQQGRGTFVIEKKRQLTGKIGLLLRTYGLANPHVMDLIFGMRREARKSSVEILLLDEAENSIDPDKVDGVVMCCNVAEALAIHLPDGLPHALMLERSPDFISIVPDDFEGAKMITRHLLDLGHTRIGFLFHDVVDSITPQRLAGYRAAHQEIGIEVINDRIRSFKKSGHDDYREKAELAMKQWIVEDWHDVGCTALLAQNDEVAIGIISALSSAGLRVPGDISVVGFDGTRVSTLCTPPLTTVKVPLQEIGTRAVKVLLEQIYGGAKQPEKIVLPVQLKIGQSTAPISVTAP